MNRMTKAQFAREATYRATMNAAKKAAEAGVLLDADVERIRLALIARDQPPIGRLRAPLVLDKSGEQSDV